MGVRNWMKRRTHPSDDDERRELLDQLAKITEAMSEMKPLQGETYRQLVEGLGTNDHNRNRIDQAMFDAASGSLQQLISEEARVMRRLEHLDLLALTGASIRAANGVRAATWVLAAATIVLIVVTALN